MGMAWLLAFLSLALMVIVIYNWLVLGRVRVQESFSGIDVQLKRRHDLIPNIVEAVKGYMQHERSVLENVTALRSQVMGATGIKERAALENNITQALKTLFAVAENYPDLKANQNFLELQRNLSEIENEIQLARRYYNGTVRDYNIQVQTFPSNLIAQVFQFKTADFFEAEAAEEREAPGVKF
jgi:LemA protein